MSRDRAPGLRVHERTFHVQAAEGRIDMALINMQQELELTNVEMIRALLGHIQHISTRLLRAERHPEDPDRKADEE